MHASRRSTAAAHRKTPIRVWSALSETPRRSNPEGVITSKPTGISSGRIPMQTQSAARSQTYQEPPRVRRADGIATDRIAAVRSRTSAMGTSGTKKIKMAAVDQSPPEITGVPTTSQAGTSTTANH